MSSVEAWNLALRNEERQVELGLEPWPLRWGERTAGVIKSADQSWPQTVQDAWESYRRARGAADCFRLEEFRDEPEDAGLTPDARQHARDAAECEAQIAYKGYSKLWEEWKYGPQLPTAVTDAMQSFIQAQSAAEYLAGIHARIREAEPKPPGTTYSVIRSHRFCVERAYQEASDAQRQADLALDNCCEAWRAWERGAATPAERGDFEADE